jgi:hypothetical protein
MLHSYYDVYVSLSAANSLSDQLMLQVLRNLSYVQLCFQPMYDLTAAPEQIDGTRSADDSIAL